MIHLHETELIVGHEPVGLLGRVQVAGNQSSVVSCTMQSSQVVALSSLFELLNCI